MSAFQSVEKKQKYPILIVDKIGVIGERLIEELKQEALIIFVSAKRIEDPNVIHIPYLKKIPAIPDNSYSHIFIIDEYGKISKNFITPFVNKAKQDLSKLILAININYVDDKFVNDFVLSFEKAKILIFSGIFTKDFIFNSSTYVNKFIQEVRSYKEISVPNDGTKLTSPVFFDDVITSILQVGFIEDETSRIFFAFAKNIPTLLSLAHMFQKRQPGIKIDFVKEKSAKEEKTEIKAEGKYILGDDYDIAEKINKVDLENENKEKIERGEYEKESNAGIKVKLNYLFVSVFLVAGFFFLLPFISTLFFSVTGLLYINNLKTDLQNQNLTGAKNDAFAANVLLKGAKISSLLLKKEATVFGKENQLSSFSTKLDQGIEISYGASTLLGSIDKLNNLISGGSQSRTDFANVSQNFKSALVIYQKQKEAGNIPKSLDAKLNDLISIVATTIDLWPQILGFDKPKNYLVLFQNNTELRPGGGFIGSYGILSIDKSKVKSFKIYDVYDADGQLKDHVEPPFAIRRYLKSTNWYLRDSNFDVDFSKDAVASSVFLNSEMHQSIDGVIGVDLSFVKNLLGAIGPVEVTDYKETVTSDNLFKVVNAHVKDKFFPGSTQKKDFLTALYSSIQAKLSDKNKSLYLNLLSSISNSVYEKHIVFAFNNISLQSVFSINGWGSTLIDNRKSSKNHINDFIGINEANLGANKVNYYITRSVSQITSVGKDGSIKENLKINFKNSADKSLGKDGLYKSYVRIITPLGTKINSISIDGVEQKIVSAIKDPNVYESKNFVPPTGFEIESNNESNKAIFGFLNLVEPGSLKSIEISYTLLPKIDNSQNNFSYDLKVFKQPGIDSFPYSFSLSYQNGLRPIDLFKNIGSATNKIFFSETLARDKEVNFNFAKQ